MLLVDADPQGQVALGLGFPKKVRVTLKNMLENIIMGLEFDPKEVILKHKEGVEVIPANKLLAGLDVALINVEDREKVLKEYLELLEDDYDYILIDCMPSLGMMVINALYAADAMEKRDELRTVEKIKVFNENSKILQQISSVRECIDKQCTCCLETLVKLHLDNKGKDYIEFEYQKSVQRFNRFLDEVMNMNVWKYIDKYNNIFMQENL